jgi:hypothetical protein
MNMSKIAAFVSLSLACTIVGCSNQAPTMKDKPAGSKMGAGDGMSGDKMGGGMGGDKDKMGEGKMAGEKK